MSPLPEITVAAAIIWKNKKELVSLRKSHQHLGGYWEFPGGKPLPGEALAACVKREVKEEIGIEIKVEKLFSQTSFEYPEKKVTLFFFECSYLSGEAQSLEVEQVLWADLAQLKTLGFAPANQSTLEQLFHVHKNQLL